MIQDLSLTSGDAAPAPAAPSPGSGSALAIAPASSRNIPTRGQVPAFAAALFCLASVIVGVVIDHQFLQVPAPAPRIALVEQGAIVLEALLNRPELDETSARRFVGQTVAAVVGKYERSGYLVVNANPGSDGQMVIEAVPKSAIDISDEMRTAVARAVSGASSGAAPAALSSKDPSVSADGQSAHLQAN